MFVIIADSLTTIIDMSWVGIYECFASGGSTIWVSLLCWPSLCNCRTNMIETCKWLSLWSLSRQCPSLRESSIPTTWFRHLMTWDYSTSVHPRLSPMHYSSALSCTLQKTLESHVLPYLPWFSRVHALSVKRQWLAISRPCLRSWSAHLAQVWALVTFSRPSASWPSSTMEWNPWTTSSSCRFHCFHTSFSSCTLSRRVWLTNSIRMFLKLKSKQMATQSQHLLELQLEEASLHFQNPLSRVKSLTTRAQDHQIRGLWREWGPHALKR